MKSLYKYSKFNIVADEDADNNKILLYNTYSLRYRWIDKFTFEDINDKDNIDLGDVPVYLAEEGFIIPSDMDEIQRLKDDAKAHLEKADFMFISIFTTLACNYRCVYCFEKNQLCNEFMTKETADDIIAFVKRRYSDHHFTMPLKIKWFGGEPLLNMEIIRYISKELHSNKINFTAKLYTNGRLLTKETAAKLKTLGVTDEVVIPIDGLAPTYARLKNCKEEDFYRTIENIKACEDILKIIIHINVSEASKNDVKPLLDLLRNEYKIKSKITLINVAPKNTNVSNENNNITYDEFQKTLDMSNRKNGLITRKYYCEGRLNDYYVVGTKGELYICEHLIGQQKYIVENIKNQSRQINRAGTIWDNNRIIDDCKDCPILPICAGLCVTDRYIDNIDCQREKRIRTCLDALFRGHKVIRPLESKLSVDDDF